MPDDFEVAGWHVPRGADPYVVCGGDACSLISTDPKKHGWVVNRQPGRQAVYYCPQHDPREKK